VAGVREPEFWEDLYDHDGDGWQLEGPAPTLVEVIESTPPPCGRVAVPGCGRGHDVRFLAGRGYNAVGFDFAPAALAAARAFAERDGVTASFERRDVFSLAADFAGAFDGVWEYTCFCAIDPRRRAEYVRVLEAILKPGGWLLACFYPIRTGGGGPPFAVSKTEVSELLSAPFRIERAGAPLQSPAARRGQEWMVLARKPDPSG
jgi:SAM-dependent methyltransferase